MDQIWDWEDKRMEWLTNYDLAGTSKYYEFTRKSEDDAENCAISVVWFKDVNQETRD